MAQKVIKIGSSAGITLSPDVLHRVGLKIGDAVHVSGGQHEVLVRPAEMKPTIDPHILSWTNEFIEKNRALLERLADK